MLALLLSGSLLISSVASFEGCDIVTPEYCPVIWGYPW